MKHILLISGGMDSSLLYRLKKEVLDRVIYIDYGHKHRDAELEVAKRVVTDHEIEVLSIPNLPSNDRGFFYGRNLRFFIAVREAIHDVDVCVYFGNCADDNFNDNTREYLARVEKVINDSYPLKTMRIICPLENHSKREIAQLAGGIGYWCDLGEAEPCGKCHSCAAMIDAGVMKAAA